MKTYKIPAILFFVLLILASCDHNVSMETTVHEDGSLDKVMTFENGDSAKNIMGLTKNKGWESTVRLKAGQTDSTKSRSKEKKFITTFKKSFSSVEAANAELAIPNDSVFLVTSTFEKKFRWFYTYIYYADTYHALNRLDYKPEDYLTPEDYAFIDRLPAEGAKISKADSFFMEKLNERIFDAYGTRAFYEAYFNLGAKVIKDNNLESKWVDSLRSHKEDIFQMLTAKKDVEDDFMLDVMDSLKIPLPYEKIRKDYKELYSKLELKSNFISTAYDGKYKHRINMPWEIVKTNADSTAANSAFWSPPAIKFLLKDYTMFAEARKLNWWTIVISALVIGFTGYLFLRKAEIVIRYNDRIISIPRKKAP
jgi:hypothetical protein